MCCLVLSVDSFFGMPCRRSILINAIRVNPQTPNNTTTAFLEKSTTANAMENVLFAAESQSRRENA